MNVVPMRMSEHEQRAGLKKVPPKVTLSAIEAVLPITVRSIYRAVQRGRSPSWLSHLDPSGLPTREYWVDVRACLLHYSRRGIELRLEVVERQ
jgi:hypothetical protein